MWNEQILKLKLAARCPVSGCWLSCLGGLLIWLNCLSVFHGTWTSKCRILFSSSSTENKTVLPGGSRKLYISVRKVIELWMETRAVISWVTPTTAFLMRQLIVASRLGRTEYQLLLMKTSWWDRNVKIRCKCFGRYLWIWLISIYQLNESIFRNSHQHSDM